MQIFEIFSDFTPYSKKIFCISKCKSWQTVEWMDDGQSNSYVVLCFTGGTKNKDSMSHLVEYLIFKSGPFSGASQK